MYEYIISNYINNLTQNDIIYFGLKNDIHLTNSEVDYIYHTIKNNYKTLLGEEYEIIFEEAKKYLTRENYEKICKLFMDYRNKFKDFLK